MNCRTPEDQRLSRRGAVARLLSMLAVAGCGAVLSAAAVTPAWALDMSAKPALPDKTSVVGVKLEQFKVVTEGGRERFVSADGVKPGDLIEYRAIYTNVSTKPVAGLVATLPIPEAVDYVAKSASASSGIAAQAASKDGLWAAEPLTRNLRLARGAQQEQMVPYNEYRKLRWQVGQLAAGASVTVKARATVSVEPVRSPVALGGKTGELVSALR